MAHPLERRDYTGRFVMNGRGRTTWAWGLLSWEGQMMDEWDRLPDGRSVFNVIDDGDVGSLPECWIRITNTGKYGDILWTGASLGCFVSQRLLDVLNDLNATGFEAIPLELRPKRGAPIQGYSMVYFDNHEDDDLRPFPPFYRGADSFDTTARVKDALEEAGVTNMEVREAEPWVKEILADK